MKGWKRYDINVMIFGIEQKPFCVFTYPAS